MLLSSNDSPSYKWLSIKKQQQQQNKLFTCPTWLHSCQTLFGRVSEKRSVFAFVRLPRQTYCISVPAQPDGQPAYTVPRKTGTGIGCCTDTVCLYFAPSKHPSLFQLFPSMHLLTQWAESASRLWKTAFRRNTFDEHGGNNTTQKNPSFIGLFFSFKTLPCTPSHFSSVWRVVNHYGYGVTAKTNMSKHLSHTYSLRVHTVK